MRTSLHLKPGRKGTKQLLAQYGDRLVCVRYRHDTQQKKRFKTVELIVAEWAWEPPVPQIPADHRVALRMCFAEVELRERVKQARGKWNPRQNIPAGETARCTAGRAGARAGSGMQRFPGLIWAKRLQG